VKLRSCECDICQGVFVDEHRIEVSERTFVAVSDLTDRLSIANEPGENSHHLAEASEEEKGLSKWRRTSIQEALCENGGKLKQKLDAQDVVRAKRILEEDGRPHRGRGLHLEERVVGLDRLLELAAALQPELARAP